MPCTSWIFSSKVMRLTSSRARASESCAQTATLPLASTASRIGNTNLPNNLMNTPPRVYRESTKLGPGGGGTCRVVQIAPYSLLNPSTSSIYGTNEPGLAACLLQVILCPLVLPELYYFHARDISRK